MHLSLQKTSGPINLPLIKIGTRWWFQFLQAHAVSWFIYQLSRSFFVSWEYIKQLMIARFGVDGQGQPSARLYALKQVGFVAEFVHEFED